jgi:hypothetical protein
MNSLAKKDTGLTRPLKVLVPLIKDELEAGDAAGVEHYRRAGEMLLEAKEQVEHGEWGAWVERNFHLSRRTASDYMKLAERQNGRRLPFSSIEEAVHPNRNNQPARSWHAPVQQIAARVNYEALAQERESKAKEAELLHKLSIQLIDIGYRVLAAKLHPDKAGGSHEAMQRLNEVRRRLRGAV